MKCRLLTVVAAWAMASILIAPMAIFGETPVEEVNLYAPGIYDVDFQDSFGMSLVNGMADAGSPGAAPGYRVVVNAYDPDGWGDISEVHLRAWYDEGLAAVPNYGPEMPDSRENLQFHMVFDTALGFCFMVYPEQSDPEVATAYGGCFMFQTSPTDLSISLGFAMHEQVRAAAGPFTEMPGQKFDGGFPGSQSGPFALNDPYTWDFEVEVLDSALGSARAYDEFGIYRYLSLDALEMPGEGHLYACGPPSTTDVLFNPSNSDLLYHANCEHNLGVWITDLAHEELGFITIPATSIAVSGGEMSARISFAGAGPSNTLYLLGESYETVSSKSFSRTTSITDFSGTLPVTFWVDIPAVPSGTYSGMLTYILNGLSVQTEISVSVPEWFDIPVSAGWNLISLPLAPVSESIAIALMDRSYWNNDAQWDRAMCFDSWDTADHWEQYSVSWAPSLNDLACINSSRGIWLHVTDPGDGYIEIWGTWLNCTQTNLRAGWNLVGYPTLTTGVTVAEAFAGTGADIVEVVDLAQPYLTRVAEQTYVMTPGEGYWVHVPSDIIWTVYW
ncbi:MAG: hypothetical protein V1934_09085 [Methanobacteriota archaeon]